MVRMKKVVSKSLSWLLSAVILFGGIVGLVPLVTDVGLVVNAEEDYVFIDGAVSMREAPTISLDIMYASSLTKNEKLYYKFTTPAQKGFIDFYSMNINISTDTLLPERAVQFDIVNRLGEVLARNGLQFGKSTSQNISLKVSGEYYIIVYNNWLVNDIPGNLKFKLSFISDEIGDDMSTANQAILNSKISSTLDGDYDVDCFCFTTPSNSECTLELTNADIDTVTYNDTQQFYGQIRSSINETLLNTRVIKGRTLQGKVSLQPNTVYYLFIGNPSKGRGNYTFQLNFPETITLSKTSLSLQVGSSASISVSVEPQSNSDIKWSTSDNKVATVSNGKVKAVGIGKAEITAETATGKTASCTVTVQAAALKNSSTVSATSVNLGTAVTIKAVSSGGTTPHTYAYYYKKAADSSYSVLKGFSTTKTAYFNPTAAGKYNIRVVVKDASGQKVRKDFTITVKAPLTNTSVISASSVKKGNSVKVTAKATGGIGKYTYGVYYKKATSEKWTTAQSYGTNTTVTIKPAAAVKYNICVKVKDSSGKIVKKYFDITCTK